MNRAIKSIQYVGPGHETWEALMMLEETLEMTFPELNFYGIGLLHVIGTREDTPPGGCVRVLLFCPIAKGFEDELRAIFPAIQAWLMTHGITAAIAPRRHADDGIISHAICNLIPETVEIEG